MNMLKKSRSKSLIFDGVKIVCKSLTLHVFKGATSPSPFRMKMNVAQSLLCPSYFNYQ